jgi:signal peptidase I
VLVAAVLPAAAALGAVLAVPALTGGPSRLVVVAGTSMEPTLSAGDVVVVWPRRSYRRGDVVVYPVPRPDGGRAPLVIHRVVGGDAGGYRTRGDNKAAVDPWRPAAGELVGAQVVVLPRVGVVLALLRQPGVVAALAAGLVTTALSAPRRRGPSWHWELPDGTRLPAS